MGNSKKRAVLVALAVVMLGLCFAAGYFLSEPERPLVAGEGPEVASEKPRDPHVVYEDDFTGEVGPQWNVQVTDRTPEGQRPYLGGFEGNDRHPVLTLARLPAHRLVRLTFDLYLMRSWDGSSPTWGPGLMDIKLGGGDGRSLLHTTFANCGFFSDNNEQAFPDNYPARPFGAWTLAAEHQTLGTIQSWGGPERTFDTSAVYHMVYSFPHSGPAVVVQFTSTIPRDPSKVFGLANVKVEALPELATYTAAEFEEWWRDLGSPDARKFYEARWKLVAAGDAATDYIAKHFQEIDIPANPIIKTPGGKVKPYPMELPMIHRERARWVLEAIHTPAALALKGQIPTVGEGG